MKISSTKKENSVVRLEVRLPWEDIYANHERVISKLAQQIKEPGFRTGKTPVSLVRKKYKNEIESQFIDDIIKTRYADFIKEADIEPVDSGNLVEVNFQEGGELSLSIEVQVEPEFKLYDYKKNSLEVSKHVIEIEDRDVERAIEELREQHAEVKVSAKPAEKGNILEVDIQELDESLTPLIGKKVEKRLIKVGEGEFGGKAAEQLEGAVPGDERVINITQEHGDHSHKFVFRFTINSVEEHSPPNVDDEFAKMVNEKFNSVDDLKESLKQNIQTRYNAESRNLVDNALADELVRVTDIEVPEKMLDSYLEGIVNRAKENGESDVDEGFIRENYRAGAIWNLKWLMIRKSIFRKENFKVENSEIDEWMDKTAMILGLDKPAVLSMKNDENQREKVQQDIIESKVMGVLRKNAKFNEQKLTASEFSAMLNSNHHHH